MQRNTANEVWKLNSVASVAILALFALALVALQENVSRAQEPNLNDRFPVHDSSNLSRPTVQPRIHECALAVWVYGSVPEAIVQVFAKNPVTGVDDPVGKDAPVLGFGEIKLKRPLILGELITATQTVGAITSAPSYAAVTVEAYPALTRPVVGPDMYACGRVVPVRNLIESTHIELSDLDVVSPLPPLLGTGETTRDWEPVVTRKLVAGHRVRAVQIACPNDPAKRVSSTPSLPVKVKPEPLPLAAPSGDPVVLGTKAVPLHNLLVGAEIVIKDKLTGNTLGDGLAAASGEGYVILAKPVTGPIIVTQSLCSSSPPAEIPATDHLPPPILGFPICEGSHFVMVDNTVLFAKVVLVRNNDSQHPIGYAGGMAGTLPLPVGGLKPHDKLTVFEYIGSVMAVSNEVEVGCDGGANVVTQHNDNGRTGAYLAETTLSPKSVLSRGMVVKYTHPMDGTINAQPLYVRRVSFQLGAANGLFVATLSDKDSAVYGLDADTGAEKWKTPLIDSDPEKRGTSLGVDTTPVIDVQSGRMYVALHTRSTDTDASEPRLFTDEAFWLVALDYRDGSEKARVRVGASVLDADGKSVNFIAKIQVNHAALLLDHGSIYIAFCSNAGLEGDTDFHGWVMKYRASDLAFQNAFCTSKVNPPGHGAGIWQGGGGLASDPDGNIYFLTGNGAADPFHHKYGDSFVKLTPTPGGLIPTAFIPPDALTLNHNDLDLGSGGALTIPGSNLVIGGGKTGFMYLLNRSTMRRVQQITATINKYDPSQRGLGKNDPDAWKKGPHLHGSPTYWRGPDPKFGNLYVWGEKDVLRLYRFDTAAGKFVEPAFHRGTVRALRESMPGGMISLSANGNAAGSGIVWATLPASDKEIKGVNPPWPGHLYAFDGQTLKPLWDGGFSTLGHWTVPTIANGTVYIGTSSNELIAYTLGPHDSGRQSWKPFQPRPTSHQVSLAKRYPDEASILALPRIALSQIAPPPGLVKGAVLEGNGERIYEAKKMDAEGGGLTWKLKVSIANRLVVRSSGTDAERGPIWVRLSPEDAWSASDGSRAVSVVEKTVPAPETTDAPWLLYRVTETGGQGILSNVRYIQCAFTSGGGPPRRRPSRSGAMIRVPYHAQYILLQKGD